MSERDEKDRLPIEGVVPAGVGGQAFVPRDTVVPDVPAGDAVDEVIDETPLPDSEVAADPPEGDDDLLDAGSPEFDHSLRKRPPS